MPKRHWRGISVPTSADPITSSLEGMAQSSGVITRVESIAVARATLTTAEAAGTAPTAQDPAYFDIRGILYTADGTKRDGAFVLRAMNEVETNEVTYQSKWGPTELRDGQYTGFMTATLGAQPYPRIVLVNAALYVYAVSGIVDGLLSFQGRRVRKTRAAESEVGSVDFFYQGWIPSGVQPRIEVGLIGAAGRGGRAASSTDTLHNHLTCTALPVTASGVLG